LDDTNARKAMPFILNLKEKLEKEGREKALDERELVFD
jgi:hypothetical protein